MDDAAFKPLLGVISESLNCSITLAVTAAEMASVMVDLTVLHWMNLCNLGFSPIFLLEAMLLKLKLLRYFIFYLILISSG
jgi:hypothetical protein